MPSAQRTIVIGRPLDQVFGFFSDPVNDRSWRPAVKEISTDDPPGVGRRIRQVIAGPGGRGISADIEVTGYEPPSRYAFHVVAGPARPNGEFRFIETPNGTEVHFSLAAELGGIKKWFLSGPVQRSMDGEMAGLDTAKRLIEGS
jgi:carbon monoxide dehydrogenase subunit G